MKKMVREEGAGNVRQQCSGDSVEQRSRGAE